MIELCAACGRVLPTECGKQICRTCELTADIKFMEFACPSCGEKLEIFSTYVARYNPHCWDGWPYLNVDLIYHCNKCGNDWDSEYTQEFGDEGQTALKRHYWG